MSAGLVSMSIKELLHWDVILRVWVKGDRKDYYNANTDVWHMVTRVMREREYHLLQSSHRELDDALGELETTEGSPELTTEHIEFLKPKVQALSELAGTFSTLLDGLLTQAELNLEDVREHGELP